MSDNYHQAMHNAFQNVSAQLAAAQERIASLEQQLAQQGEWMPITEWWEYKSVADIAKRTTTYNPGNNGIGIEVVYDDGKNAVREYAGENLPKNIRLCRRKEQTKASYPSGGQIITTQ